LDVCTDAEDAVLIIETACSLWGTVWS